MDKDDLLRIFDIESLEDFEDFEQFSVLMEDKENIDEDMFYDILDGIEESLISDMIDSYFDDIKQGVPDDAMEVYASVSRAGINFTNRFKQCEGHTDKMMALDELYRFRQWYLEDGVVHLKDAVIEDSKDISICEALVFFRIEKLSEGKFEYDFSDVEEFITEEYLDHDDYDDEDDEDEEEFIDE